MSSMSSFSEVPCNHRGNEPYQHVFQHDALQIEHVLFLDMLKSIELVEGNDQRRDRLARDDKTLAESILSTQIAGGLQSCCRKAHREKGAHFCNIFACGLCILCFLLSPENLQHAFYNCCISYYSYCKLLFCVSVFFVEICGPCLWVSGSNRNWDATVHNARSGKPQSHAEAFKTNEEKQSVK